MSTYISGVASCSAIDTMGEIVDIKGLDISSLEKTGTCNWEHKADTPAQTVGKIVKAKKIFDAKDCQTDNERYFWNKTKLPFVYIIAELLDDYTQSAKEVAGQFRYSKDNPDKHAILGFSVEGSELPGTRQQGVLITKSIARKVTLTCSPANKMCVAEIYEAPKQKSKIKDDLDEIFKSETLAIDLFKNGQGEAIYEQYLAKKEKTFKKDSSPPEPNQANAAAMQAGAMSGPTSFGQAMSNIASGLGFSKSDKPTSRKVPGATNWTGKVVQGKKGKEIHLSHPQHGTVTVMHNKDTNNFEVKHAGTYAGFNGKKGIFNNAREAVDHAKGYIRGIDSGKVVPPRMHDIASSGMPELKRALEAGSYNAAPSSLVNGACYQTEGLRSKKDWKKRAKEDYEKWHHKEAFEKFMKSRMPALKDGQIRAIGRALYLKKSVDMEKSLSGLVTPIDEFLLDKEE